MYPVFLVLGLILLYTCDISQGKNHLNEDLNRNRRQSSRQFIFPQQLQLGPIVPALKLPQQNFQTNKKFPFLLPQPPPLPPFPPFFPPINFQLFNPTNNPNSNNNINPNIPLAFQPHNFQPPNIPVTFKPFFPFPSFIFPFPIKTASTTTKTIVLTTPTIIPTTTMSSTTTKTTPLTSTTMTPTLSTLSSTTITIKPSSTITNIPSTTITTIPSTTITTIPSTTITTLPSTNSSTKSLTTKSTIPTTTPPTTILTTFSTKLLTSPPTISSTATTTLSTTVLITTLAPITTTCKPRTIQPTESPPTIQCTSGDGCQYSVMFERNRKVIVDNHNKRRREITEASNMYEMIWDNEAANIAQKQAESCSKEKPSTVKSSKFECNFNTYASKVGIPWAGVIAKWSDEKTSFTYGVESAGTENFTQIIWAESYLIGCAYTKCDTEYTYVCAYCPGGNNAGKRGEPYKKGVLCQDCPCGECHNSLCLPPE